MCYGEEKCAAGMCVCACVRMCSECGGQNLVQKSSGFTEAGGVWCAAAAGSGPQRERRGAATAPRRCARSWARDPAPARWTPGSGGGDERERRKNKNNKNK